MTKAEKAAQETARERLRADLRPGDTVYTVLRHVSRSGMQRSISVLVLDREHQEIYDVSGVAAEALGYRFDRDNGGVKVGGCGMDMGFHLAYNLAWVLYPKGFGCPGKGCPSNDHSNGDRDYTPNGGILHGMAQEAENRTHWHSDGGYALRNRWL